MGNQITSCPRCGRATDTIFFDLHPDIDGRCRHCLGLEPVLRWRHVAILAGALLAVLLMFWLL